MMKRAYDWMMRSAAHEKAPHVLFWVAFVESSIFPIPPDARDKLAFSYVFDTSSTEYVFYDCKRFANVPRDSCLPARF